MRLKYGAFTVDPLKLVASMLAAGIAGYLLGWLGVLMIVLLTMSDDAK